MMTWIRRRHSPDIIHPIHTLSLIHDCRRRDELSSNLSEHRTATSVLGVLANDRSLVATPRLDRFGTDNMFAIKPVIAFNDIVGCWIVVDTGRSAVALIVSQKSDLRSSDARNAAHLRTGQTDTPRPAPRHPCPPLAAEQL